MQCNNLAACSRWPHSIVICFMDNSFLEVILHFVKRWSESGLDLEGSGLNFLTLNERGPWWRKPGTKRWEAWTRSYKNVSALICTTLKFQSNHVTEWGLSDWPKFQQKVDYAGELFPSFKVRSNPQVFAASNIATLKFWGIRSFTWPTEASMIGWAFCVAELKLKWLFSGLNWKTLTHLAQKLAHELALRLNCRSLSIRNVRAQRLGLEKNPGLVPPLPFFFWDLAFFSWA